MTFTMPFGYGDTVVTEEQLKMKQTFYRLHPEVQARFLGMAKHFASIGIPMGVGTGWRVQPPDKPGFAKPGNSWHEGVPVESNMNALAIDTVPASSWDAMERDAGYFGFRTFRYVNKEPWHIQPVEIPAARNRATVLPPLQEFPFPGRGGEIPIYEGANDMFKPVHPYRNSDTRVYGGALKAKQTYEFGLNPAIVPANAVAVAMNVTIVGAAPGGFLIMWGTGPEPTTSVCNAGPDGVANGSYVGPVNDLKFKLKPNSGMHVIIDVTGYWTP